MTWLFWIVMGLAFVGLLTTLRLAQCFWTDPACAMEKTTHHPDNYARVMAGRYGFMALMVAGGLIARDLAALAWVFAGLSALGLYDAWVYATSQKPYREHLKAGILAAIVAVAALGALLTKG